MNRPTRASTGPVRRSFPSRTGSFRWSVHVVGAVQTPWWGDQALRFEAVRLQPGDRVDGPVDVARGDPGGVDLEVHVRTERAPRHADRTHRLAARDLLADLDRDRGHVRHQALAAVGVLDRDVV